MKKPKFTCFLEKQTNKNLKQIHKTRWKLLGQQEDLNAKDGLDHYIEKFWITLVDTFPHGFISWACVLACKASAWIYFHF